MPYALRPTPSVTRASRASRTIAATVAAIATLAATVLGSGTPASANAHAATAEDCGPPVAVPGAERQVPACLTDLTTTGTVATGHTDPADYAGLHATGTRTPSGVPGLQIDGYFPDTSTTNPTRGWNHDAQFVIRLPERWTGGLVVAGSPGNREQYANDVTISDWALAKGYAYAATDKGNTGVDFHRDGRRPGDAVAEWNARVTQLTRAAKETARRHYGHAPRRTYAAGISNGGYLVRWQLENEPALYDGGVDWEGTLFRARGPNLFTFLPPALRAYPAGDTSAMYQAGFAKGSEFLWDFHYRVYWGLTQRIYRAEFDPGYTGRDEDYVYADRPAEVRAAVARVSLTGRIKRPMITLHGTYDALLPISLDSDVYARLVGDRPHRYYRIEAGNHTDALYDAHPGRLRPILPCFREAFAALERWVDHKTPPPPSATLPKPTEGDLVNTCDLTG